MYTFVRNPYYDRGKSDVNVFHVKTIPDNDAKLMALRSGKVDMILGTGNLSYRFFNELKGSNGFDAIASDITIQTRTMRFNVSHKPFGDHATRLAANYAIDTATISNSLFYKVENPADTVLDKTLPYCNVDTETYDYNLEKVKQILDDAG
ncbi:ABC transporter substrate-binding protein [Oscillospiraceae bacterium PP1C4]